MCRAVPSNHPLSLSRSYHCILHLQSTSNRNRNSHVENIIDSSRFCSGYVSIWSLFENGSINSIMYTTNCTRYFHDPWDEPVDQHEQQHNLSWVTGHSSHAQWWASCLLLSFAIDQYSMFNRRHQTCTFSVIPCAMTQSMINLCKTTNDYLDDIIRLLIHINTSSDRRMRNIDNLLKNTQFIVGRLKFIQLKLIKPRSSFARRIHRHTQADCAFHRFLTSFRHTIEC